MDDILNILKEVVSNVGFWLMLLSLIPMCSWKNDARSLGPDPNSPKGKDLYILDDMTTSTWARVKWGSMLENAKFVGLILFAVYLIATSCSRWAETGLDFSTGGSGFFSVLQILLYAVIVIAGTFIWGFGGRLGTNKEPNISRGAAVVTLYALLIILDYNMVNKLAYVAALQASMLLAFAVVYCQRLPAYLLKYNTEDYLEKIKQGNITKKKKK